MYFSNHGVVVLDKITKLLYSVTKTLFLLLFLPEFLSKNILNALYEVISSENLFLLLQRLLLPMAHFTLLMWKSTNHKKETEYKLKENYFPVVCLH